MRKRSADIVAVAAVALAVLGCVARFVHLDRQWYFHDEAITSLRLSGHTGAELRRVASAGTVSVSELRSFQTVGSSPIATVKSLAEEDPQHPPLFFVAAWGYASIVGSSVTALRALAAVFGVIAVLGAAALGRQLFGNWRAGMIAAALLAVSPFQILYSQEAREYELWLVLVELSSLALLRALAAPSRQRFGAYALCACLGLYAYPNMVLVLLGHGAFVLARHGRGAILRPFVISVASAVAGFVPWLLVMAVERGALEAGTGWTGESVPLGTLLRAWAAVGSLGVVDVRGDQSSYGAGMAVVLGTVLVLQVIALVLLARFAPRDATVLLLAVAAATVLPLALADVAFGGIRSTVPRFVTPLYLCSSLALSWALDAGLAAATGRLRVPAAIVAAGVVAAGAVSYGERWSARVWWNEDDGAAASNLAAVDAVRRLDPPVLVSTGVGTLLEMSHRLPPTTTIHVSVDGTVPAMRATRAIVYGSPANGAAASRLRVLLSRLRGRYAHLRRLDPALPCCGAGIRQISDQLWFAVPKA